MKKAARNCSTSLGGLHPLGGARRVRWRLWGRGKHDRITGRLTRLFLIVPCPQIVAEYNPD